MRVIAKSDFAREVGVTPGRVSQWIAAGTIGADALEGEGRAAKIIVDRALEQIKMRRDVGQSLGNGLATRVFANDGPGEHSPVTLPRPNDVAYQIQLERLKSERRKNERDAIDEEVRRGRLVPADDVRAQMSRLARQVDEVNAAMLADFASAIAGKFGLPQRDVLHLLREVRNEKKGSAAEAIRERLDDVEPTVEYVIEEGDEA